jgi:NADPH2:quinone reductase
VGVVLDYLWGDSARAILIAAAKSAPEAVPIRFVQIGTASGGDVVLPPEVLRAVDLRLMGSGAGSIPPTRLLAVIAAVLAAAGAGKLVMPVQVRALAEVAEAWQDTQADGRIVLVP